MYDFVVLRPVGPRGQGPYARAAAGAGACADTFGHRTRHRPATYAPGRHSHARTHPADGARPRCAALLLAAALGLAAAPTATVDARTLIDAHLHYSGVDAAALPPEEIVRIFDANDVSAAVVSGTPTAFVERLHAHAPGRVIPFLGVYRSPADKSTWMDDDTLPARVEQALAEGLYRGIGEIHLFAGDRGSPVLRALVRLAAENDLVMQVHGDPAVVAEILSSDPRPTVIWAHLGTDPRPAVLRAMLSRFPEGLYVDTSVRDARFVDDAGRLHGHWRRFFIDHADRVVVGVDTYWTRRWKEYGAEAARIRAWLAQLPADVADRLASGNMRRLFGLPDG